MLPERQRKEPKMQDINIRPVTIEDLVKFRDLRLESLKNEPYAFLVTYDDELQVTEEKWRERIDNSVKGDNGVMVVAETEGNLVGLVGITYGRHPKIKHSAHIWGTYVTPDFRGKGIGRRLMEKVIEIAKANSSVKKIKIEVVAEQESAAKLYEKMGFIHIGTAKDELFVDGTYFDIYIMEMYI